MSNISHEAREAGRQEAQDVSKEYGYYVQLEIDRATEKLTQENASLEQANDQLQRSCDELSNGLSASYYAREKLEKQVMGLRAALQTEQPWPLTDILKMLCEATRHLLDNHDCDHHGHEGYRNACNLGLQAINKINTALSSTTDISIAL